MAQDTETVGFHHLHSRIDPNPVVELNRRLQMWASVPNAVGGALTPSSAIVPDETIRAALSLIESQQREIEHLETEVEHFGRLACDDLGKNPPVFWKDEVIRLKSELSNARRKGIEDCAEIAASFHFPYTPADTPYGKGFFEGQNSTVTEIEKALRALLTEEGKS